VEARALTSRLELSAAGLQVTTCAGAGGGPVPLICPVQVSARLHASKLPADPLLPALRATLTLGTLEARLSPEQLQAVSAAAAQLRAAAAAASGPGSAGPDEDPGARSAAGGGSPAQGLPGELGGRCMDDEAAGQEADPQAAPRLELELASGTVRVRSWPDCQDCMT